MDNPYPHCKCGKTAVLKEGKHGKFFACPDWPTCPGETCSFAAWDQHNRNSAMMDLANIETGGMVSMNREQQFLRSINRAAKADPHGIEASLLDGPMWEDTDTGDVDPEWQELDNSFKPD